MDTPEHKLGSSQDDLHVDAPSIGEDASQSHQVELTEAPSWTRASEEEGRDPEGSVPSRTLEGAAVSPSPWFDLLGRVVQQMSDAGEIRTAAGVSLRMRKEDPTFSPRAAGFGTFGRFLRAAQGFGVISTVPTGEAGNADILVRLPDEGRVEGVTPQTHRRLRWVRADLWRPVLDWDNPTEMGFARRTHHIGPAEDFDPADQFVPIPRISKEQYLEWMARFAAASEPSLRSELEGALASNDPIREFFQAVRSESASNRKWNRTLQSHALSVIAEWATANGIPEGQLADKRRDALVEPPRAVGRSLPPPDVEASFASQSESQVRGLMKRAIDRMPISEVLRISIPVEYLLR